MTVSAAGEAQDTDSRMPMARLRSDGSCIVGVHMQAAGADLLAWACRRECPALGKVITEVLAHGWPVQCRVTS